jgi:hypothetical protein
VYKGPKYDELIQQLSLMEAAVTIVRKQLSEHPDNPVYKPKPVANKVDDVAHTVAKFTANRLKRRFKKVVF